MRNISVSRLLCSLAYISSVSYNFAPHGIVNKEQMLNI